MKKIILITTLMFLQNASIASSDIAQKTCETINYYKNHKPDGSEKNSFLSGIKNLLKSNYAKAYTEKIKANKIIPPSSEVNSDALDNYILLFNPALKQETKNNLLDEYNNNLTRLQELQDNLSELIDEDSVEECIKIYDDYPATEKEYNQRMANLESNMTVQSILATKKIEKDIDRLAKREGLENTWKKVRVIDINFLLKILRSPKTANVVIVGHSDPTGYLIDSYGLPVSPKVFENLSPSIKSITFFTCFGEEVRNRYNLDSMLAEGLSLYEERHFITVGETNMQDKTPVKAFKRFFKVLDSKIAKNMRKDKTSIKNQNNIEEQQLCTLELNSTESNESFIAYLNNHMIAQVKNGFYSYEFPCDYLQDENQLRIVARDGKPASDNEFIHFVDRKYNVTKDIIFTKESSFDGGLWIFN